MTASACQLLKNPRVIAIMLTLALGNASITAQNSDWPTAPPEEVGLDSTALSEMFDYIREHEVPVHSIQIARRGKLVLDAYFYPFSPELRHDVASVTKSITSTLIGLAVEKGFIRGVQQPVLSFFPNRSFTNADARKDKLTLEHLLTMQAGWDCGFEGKEARLVEMRRSADWLQFILDLPMVAEPGTRFAYCSGNSHMLSIILSQAAGTNALAFARRELFGPLGITDVTWPADPRGYSHGWGDLQLRPRDMAKVGQLFLQRGRWGERQIVPEAWIQTATRAYVKRTTNRDHYGYAWWVKGDDFPGMFEAVGRGGQRINVWPAKDFVLVFTGGGFEPGDVAKFILKALQSDEALPVNREASARLQKRIVDAVRAPSPQPVGKLPAIASRISGKTFKLSTNSLSLSELTLTFTDSSEAQAELLWNRKRVPFQVGLDAVERFSINPLIGLPQAAKAHWLDDETLLLSVDMVGGINFYRFKLRFPQSGKYLQASVTERTGLTDEQFGGVRSP
jgi:CubicO group peptidase (beta-lactamase class C family)